MLFFMDASINVICFKSKILKDGSHPLMLRICQDGKKIYKSIGISLKDKYWNFEKNSPRKNCPNKEQILKIIEERLSEYRSQIFDFRFEGKVYTADTLIQKVENPTIRKTVAVFLKQEYERLINEGRIGNANTYKDLINSINRFCGLPDFFFSNIDVIWLDKYESWLRGNGNTENTIGIKFRSLRAVYNRAIKYNYVKRDNYPFNEYKVSKLKKQTAKRAITKAEIKKIEELDLREITTYHSPLLHFSKDLFLFSYYSCGMNLIDIAQLKWTNIVDGRIIFERHKTSKLINFAIQPPAISIIQKYEAITHNENDYIFPILSPSFHITEQQKHFRIKKVTRGINKNLKKIGEYLKLSIPLTSYVARHSFATVLKRSGVNVSLISECLGHSDLKTTQIYLDSFENSQIDEAMKNLL